MLASIWKFLNVQGLEVPRMDFFSSLALGEAQHSGEVLETLPRDDVLVFSEEALNFQVPCFFPPEPLQDPAAKCAVLHYVLVEDRWILISLTTLLQPLASTLLQIPQPPQSV